MSDYEYLYTQYGYDRESIRYIKSVDDIKGYFEEDYQDYFDCGQGYYEEEVQVLIFVDNKSFLVDLVGEQCSSKQDRGDRLYWIENLVSVNVKEVETPLPKKRFNCTFTINKITEHEIDNFRSLGLMIKYKEGGD